MDDNQNIILQEQISKNQTQFRIIFQAKRAIVLFFVIVAYLFIPIGTIIFCSRGPSRLHWISYQLHKKEKEQMGRINSNEIENKCRLKSKQESLKESFQ